jgi:hypothetical protein
MEKQTLHEVVIMTAVSVLPIALVSIVSALAAHQ